MTTAGDQISQEHWLNFWKWSTFLKRSYLPIASCLFSFNIGAKLPHSDHTTCPNIPFQGKQVLCHVLFVALFLFHSSTSQVLRSYVDCNRNVAQKHLDIWTTCEAVHWAVRAAQKHPARQGSQTWGQHHTHVAPLQLEGLVAHP